MNARNKVKIMSVIDIIENAQYVVDKHGKQTAVVLDVDIWDNLRHLLEELAEDERLGQLLAEVEQDEKLEGEAAHQAYQSYLAETEA